MDKEEFDDLDENWLKAFEQDEKDNALFYKNSILKMNIRIIYIQSNNEINKIKKFFITLQEPNKLSKEELISVIKKTNKKYSLLSLLQYNIDIDAFHLKNIYNNNNNNNNNNNFLKIIKNIDDIPFKESIKLLENLNEIVFIYYKKDSSLLSKTKKIYISSNKKQKNKTLKSVL